VSNGVVHVGAHCGEEVPEYLAQGRSPILLFEPQSLGWEAPAGVQLVSQALSHSDRGLILQIPHHLHDPSQLDTMSASCLSINAAEARKIGWTDRPCRYRYIQPVRFDHWAAENWFRGRLHSLLVVDVQGMELQVLKGFGSYLDGFRNLLIECSETPIYRHSDTAAEVCSFLSERGFLRTSPILPHGDVTFIRDDR
jgi:hypothetical protein